MTRTERIAEIHDADDAGSADCCFMQPADDADNRGIPAPGQPRMTRTARIAVMRATDGADSTHPHMIDNWQEAPRMTRMARIAAYAGHG